MSGRQINSFEFDTRKSRGRWWQGITSWLVCQREGYKTLYSPTTVTQTHSPSILGFWLRHQTSISSIFFGHSPTLAPPVSQLIDIHSQLTGPCSAASSSVSVTGPVQPCQAFLCMSPPINIDGKMQLLREAAQHKKDMEQQKEHRLVSFHPFYLSICGITLLCGPTAWSKSNLNGNAIMLPFILP